MGVEGLWKIVEPYSKSVKLEQLSNKTLCIDASIWINQFIKTNNTVNSYLLGFYYRILKLLFYNIKPIFVFDGKPPELKTSTLKKRRQQREENSSKLNVVVELLLEEKLKNLADKKRTNKENNKNHQNSIKKLKFETDCYELPDLSNGILTNIKEDDMRFDLDEFDDAFIKELTTTIDYTGFKKNNRSFEDYYKNLDKKKQYELITKLRANSRQHSNKTNLVSDIKKTNNNKEDALSFSKYQVKNLMNRNRLTQKYLEVVGIGANKPVPNTKSKSGRIVSSKGRGYMLVEKSAETIKENKKIDEDKKLPQKDVPSNFDDIFKDAIIVKKSNNELANVILDEEKISNISDDHKSDDFEDVLATRDLNNSHEKVDEQLLELEAWKKYLPVIPQIENIDLFYNMLMKLDINSLNNHVKSMEKDKEDNPGLKDELCLYLEFLQQLITYKTKKASNIIEKTPTKSHSPPDLFENVDKKKNIVTPETTNKEKPSNTIIIVDDTDIDSENRSLFTPPRSAVKSTEIKIISKEEILTKKSKSSKVVFSEELPAINNDHSGVQQKGVSTDIQQYYKNLKSSPQLPTPNKTEELLTYNKKPYMDAKESTPNSKTNVYYKTLKKQFEEDENILTKEHSKLTAIGNEVTGDMVYDCKRLLSLFGISFIDAPSEAEAQCAHLSKLGIVDGIASDDSDVLVFLKDESKSTVFRYLFKPNKNIQMYRKDSLLKSSFTQQAFIFLAYLLGCDYCDGIKSVGPKTAVQLKDEFAKSSTNSIEALKELKENVSSLRNNSSLPISSKLISKLKNLDFEEKFPNTKVAKCFEDPTVNDSAQKFEFTEPDLEGISKFMEEKVGWTRLKTKESLEPVLRSRTKYKLKTMNDKPISSYFSKLPKK